MANTLIDIYNNIIEYNGEEVTVIIDNKNISWFSAAAITKILEYERTNDAIRKLVDQTDKTTFGKLEKYIETIPKYMKPHAIFINEYGLNSLILSSKMPKAKEFKRWVIEKVLPSIRQTGSYTIKEKYKKQLAILNKKIKSYQKEIQILRNNQKKIKYKPGGLIYVLRPIDSRNPNLLKPGKTRKMKNRLYTYNTSTPDDMEVLFTIEVEDPDAVELCIKALML